MNRANEKLHDDIHYAKKEKLSFQMNFIFILLGTLISFDVHRTNRGENYVDKALALLNHFKLLMNLWRALT